MSRDVHRSTSQRYVGCGPFVSLLYWRGAFPAVEVEKGNFFGEDSLLGVLIFAQYSGKNTFASLLQFHVFWWKRGLFRGTSCKNIMFHPSMSYISLICDPKFDLS